MTIFAETERLLLREVLPKDVDGFYELDADPEVHRYLGNKPVTSRKECEDVINYIRWQYATHGIGRWAIIYKPDNCFAGWTGLKWVAENINGYTNFHDLGYRLIRRYWGQGIATESAIPSLDYAFNKLKVQDLYAAAHSENTGSNHILSKLGFALQTNFLFKNEPHNWYHMNKFSQTHNIRQYSPS